jgi:hypothetical protein
VRLTRRIPPAVPPRHPAALRRALVVALFDHAETRDPQHRRRWVVLVDGANHQLECLQQEAERRGVHIDIVDFIRRTPLFDEWHASITATAASLVR